MTLRKNNDGAAVLWHASVLNRLAALSGEIAERQGDPARGCYPSELDMAVRLAYRVAARVYTEVTRDFAEPKAERDA